MLSIIAWYLLLLILGWAVFPLAYHFLPNLSDRGYGLSRALGLLLWGFIFWLFASLHILQNDIGGTLLALILVAAASAWVLRKDGWREVLNWLREHRKIFIASEVLFLGAFILWCLMRAASPEAVGTEKPMELAFINSILRSPSFPPNDPWLSGYAISYYYFGYVMVAMLARVTGIGGAVAFNLGSATWFALTAISAYSVTYTLLFHAFQKKDEAISKSLSAFWGLLAPFFILIVSNLEGFLEMLHSRGLFWSTAPDGTLQSRFWNWLNILELNTPPTAPFSWIPERLSGIWWWRASRVLQDFDVLRQPKEIIDEFPFFTYYLSDLHAHLLTMPFAILALGIALNFYFQVKFEAIKGVGIIKWGQQWFENQNLQITGLKLANWIKRSDFWLAALALGALAFLNTWDFPIYVALFSLTYVVLRFQNEGWHTGLIWEFIQLGIYLGVAGVILYFPFYIGFSSQAGGILPSLGFFTRGVYFWVMFGSLLVPIAVWLTWLWRKRGNRLISRAGLRFAMIIIVGLLVVSYFLGWLITILPVIGGLLINLQGGGGFLAKLGGSFVYWGDLFASIQGSLNPGALLAGSLASRLTEPGTWITLFVLLAAVWGLIFSYKRDQSTEENEILDVESKTGDRAKESHPVNVFVLMVILVGIALVLVPEFVYLRDQFGWRMNTIFKFYFQTWILWGICAAYATAVLWQELQRVKAGLFRAAWVGVILMSLAYPIFAIRWRFNGVEINTLTMDSSAYIAKYNPDEMAAIQWLQSAPFGILTEAIGGSYSSYARISTYSGLPTVLGWPGHESQWRGGASEMGTREADIRKLYQATDWSEVLPIITQYHIRYIYIGQLENSLYRVSDAKFINNLKPVFQNETVTIFETPNESQ
jgi:YYY domain-containing protein